MPIDVKSCSATLNSRRKNSAVLALGCCLLALVIFTPSSYSQSGTAALYGTVKDDSGAMIPGAEVVVDDLAIEYKRRTRTSATGDFAITDIPPGAYSIRATKEGFSTQEKSALTLHADQSATWVFILRVGKPTDVVEVTAGLSIVDSATSDLGTVITSRTASDLPLNGRNFTQLLELSPGASPISVAQNSGGGSGWGGLAVGSFIFPAVNGQRNRSNMFLLDGSNDLALLGNYNIAPIIDDIEEIKIESQSDQAQFGSVAGGILDVVTKGGTNALHGSAWEFIRNEELDAKNYFSNVRNPLRQNQFGLTVGGPILVPRRRSREQISSFFFLAYEGFRQSQSAQRIVRVPTASEEEGDFSSLLANGIQLYNPFSTVPDPQNPGQFSREPFQGNIIPKDLLSPAAELYSTLFPAAGPELPGGNLFDATKTLLRQDSYTGRIDQNFGTRDSFFARVSNVEESSSGSAGFPGAESDVSIRGWNVAVRELHQFTESSLLSLHFGRNVGNDLVLRRFPNASSSFPTELINRGFSQRFMAGFSAFPGSVVPLISIDGYASTSGYNGQTEQLANTYEFAGDFTKLLRRNTIKAGYSYSNENFHGPLFAAGESFSAFQTSNLESPEGTNGRGTGDALASFLLGVPTGALWRDVLVTEHSGTIQAGYIQDAYKATSRLFMNIGFRYDLSRWPVYGSLREGNGYVGDLDLSSGTYILSGEPPDCSDSRGAPCIPGGALPANILVTGNSTHNLHRTDFSNWQGRLGLAFRFSANNTIRAGYGRYYDEWNGVAQSAQNIGGTWPSVGALNNNSLNHDIPAAMIGNPLGFSSAGLLYPPTSPFESPSYYYDPRLKTPLTDSWSAQLDQRLDRSSVLTIAYVGSHAERLDLGGMQNTAKFPAAGDAETVAQRRPFPYISPTNYDLSTGNSNYNALQVTLNRISEGGVSYWLSYTWSKSIDLACSGDYGVEGCELQNAYDPRRDRSVAGFDVPQSFTGSVLYDLPFGSRARTKVIGALISGWQVNAIAVLHSGTPYDVVYQGDLANTGNTFVRANLTGNPRSVHSGPPASLNTSAFSVPPPYTFGSLGRNALRTDGSANLDASLFKRGTVGEKLQFEIRAEVFNVTNGVAFGTPQNVMNAPAFGVVTVTSNTPSRVLK